MNIVAFWSEYPVPALTLLVITGIAVLYLTRRNSHALIERVSRGGYRFVRLLARSCAVLAARIGERNREVMLALQMEIARRQLEREFQRVAAAVEQDMTKFQHLERSINEHITLMGEDFDRSAQIPPAPPGWVEAVDAIAKLQTETNPEPVGRVLHDIHGSVLDQQREVMREYRWAVNARHKILADLRPLWRGVSKQVTAVGRDSRELLARAHRIDTQMAAFRELCANRADVRVESFLARWLVALVLSVVVVGLALLNVNLLTAPLAKLVSGPGMTSRLTAVAFTVAVLAVAFVLSEALRVSRLLPLIGGLPRRPRAILLIFAGALLLALASGEALLLASDAAARAVDVAVLAVWGAASAGFVVPLLLALLLPALEAFLATSRPVLAGAAMALLTVLAVLLRLSGRAWLELGRLTHRLYDLVLFFPLAIEQTLAERRRNRQLPDQESSPTADPAAAKTANIRRLFPEGDSRTAD